MKIPLNKINQLKDKALEEAYIRVCELIGPNNYEFEELFEKITASLIDTYTKEYKHKQNSNK